jgi:methyl-accepting chemotaxis protein
MSNAALKIVEKESMETELKNLRGQLDAINKAQAVIEFNLDGTIISANSNFLKTTSYSLDEITGKHHRMFVDPEYADSSEYKSFWQRLSKGELESGEYKRVGKGGKEVWLQASYNPVFGEDGKPIKVVKFATDITTFKAELLVRTNIMNMTSIVSEANLKGDIMSVNDKFIEVSKYSREELLGKPHNTTRHPDMPKEVFKEMWSTIGRGNIFRGIVKNRAKDGTPYYVDAVIAPILGENGKPKKYLGVRYDITEAELERQNMRGIFRAIDSTYAYIEFDTKGNILSTNKLFQETMGYSPDELKGKHHKMFCDSATVGSHAYDTHWSELAAGKSQTGVFKRISKAGKTLWLQAVYAPVTDEVGRVVKVVKIATDITAANLKNADYQGQIDAIGKAQAVIEFAMDGTVNSANENFLKTVGYSLDEIKGKHHRMFCDSAYANSNEYKMFWEKLNRGEFDTAEYRRVGKGGKVVRIQASYNPIFDLNGKPFKVVKYATDLTEQKNRAQALVSTLNETANQLAAASEELSATATQLSKNSEKTSQESQSAASAAEEVSKGVASVATNSEEMAASIKEIALSSSKGATMSKDSMVKVHATNQTINKLGDSSKQIGDVIKVISSIAQQTNLLALNATIEAARAGDAGKGFAVVANEVKELAKQTAKATEDITNKIAAIQGDTQGAVTAIGEISKAVEALNGISMSIAAAVEEQSATTNEVTRVTKESSEAVVGISATAKSVLEAANQSSAGASQTLEAAKSLTMLADKLKELVSRIEV